MDTNRLNKKIFMWAIRLSNNRYKNWSLKVCQKFRQYDFIRFCNNDTLYAKECILKNLPPKMYDDWMWIEILHGHVQAVIIFVHKKLFKTNFETEYYVRTVYKISYSGALAKFRSEICSIAIKLGRYHGLQVEQRFCFHCKNIVEDEAHVVLHCPL
jgi:hypothetical protein